MSPAAPQPPKMPPARLRPTSAGSSFRLPRFATFHFYASWLVSISWKRFTLLALGFGDRRQHRAEAAAASAGALQTTSRSRSLRSSPRHSAPAVKHKGKGKNKPAISFDKPIHYDVTIDEKGIRIAPRGAASAASDASSDV